MEKQTKSLAKKHLKTPYESKKIKVTYFLRNQYISVGQRPTNEKNTFLSPERAFIFFVFFVGRCPTLMYLALSEQLLTS